MPEIRCTLLGAKPPPRTMDRPPNAAALVIGNEILSGKVEEANLAPLARLMRGAGVQLDRVVVVMDDVDAIAREVKDLAANHDWLFTSGGIGPTHDDVTVEAVARAFGTRVVSSPELAAMLRAHYGERCTEAHLRMALIPEGAALETTAQIVWPTIRFRNTWLLPGIPEVFRMKLAVVLARLGGAARGFVSRGVYVQLDEGVLKPLLDEVVSAFTDVAIGSYPTWRDPAYKTKITFDGRDEARVLGARDAFVASLPPGEPQRVD
jgi:molybdenum cofactor synthesis domain-containing protein